MPLSWGLLVEGSWGGTGRAGRLRQAARCGQADQGPQGTPGEEAPRVGQGVQVCFWLEETQLPGGGANPERPFKESVVSRLSGTLQEAGRDQSAAGSRMLRQEIYGGGEASFI